MAKRRFDISKSKKGKRTKDRGPKASLSALREKKIVDEVIGELSTLSLGEMMDALSTLDEPAPQIRERRPSRNQPIENEIVSLEDVYGTTDHSGETEGVESLDDFDASLVEEPVGESVDAPVEEPVGESVDAPAEEPIEEAIDEVAEAPVEEVAGAPAEELIDESSEAPVDEINEVLAEDAIEEIMEGSVEEPSEPVSTNEIAETLEDESANETLEENSGDLTGEASAEESTVEVFDSETDQDSNQEYSVGPDDMSPVSFDTDADEPTQEYDAPVQESSIDALLEDSTYDSFEMPSDDYASDAPTEESTFDSYDSYDEPVDDGFGGFEEETGFDADDSFLSYDSETEESLPEISNENEEAEEERVSPVSGVVRDEIVLFLLQSELVSMSQVFDAIKERKEGKDLWRVLADHPELDTKEIHEAVANDHGYDSQPYLESAPTKEFVAEVLDFVAGPDLARFVTAGLLPTELDLNIETGRHELVVLSTDPLDGNAQAALLSSPIPTTCRYSDAESIPGSLAEIFSWLPEFGVEIDEDGQVIDAEPEAESEQLSNYEVVDNASEEDSKKAATERSEETPAKGRVRKNKAGREKKSAMDRVVKQLIADNVVDDAKLAEATAEWEEQGGTLALWRIVADLPGMSRERVYETAAKVYAFKQEKLSPGRPDHDFVRLTMETLGQKHHDEMLEMLLVPFEHSIDYETGTGRIVFVTPDPTRPEINRLVHELELGRFELRYSSETEILKLYDELFPRKNEYLERISDETDAFDLGMSYDEGDDIIDEDALEAEISRSKLINLFEASLVEAVRQGVSDVHLFPNPNRQVEIHFRVDGRLKKWHTEDKVHPEAFLAVVKDNSTNVDRFERDAAQDGFIQREIDGALIRFRVSILPIASANQELRAESIVIRILDDRKVLTDITKLGMLDVAMQRFNMAIRQPHGMVILTGPTGSGKSTTLVAALYQVVTPEVNVLTVEDPVEYIIKGVRQIKLSNKLDLEGALRAILRHDPDIVMVGEMRDKYTAELAIKLANTGHLTFSTLHTNDAPAAVSRLYKMGVEPFLIAYAINLVVAQRLIREVCPECKEIDENPDQTMMKSLGWTEKEIAEATVYRANLGSMCPKCGGNGYKGRRAVCETLYFSHDIRTMIAESGEAIDEDQIRDQAVSEGMLTLGDSAKELVKMGATTLEEMLKMTSSH